MIGDNVRVPFVALANQKRKAEARELRRILYARCRSACDQAGDEIAGFAIVVWDARGDMKSAYDAARGPIGPALVPTLVSDALNRHVAVKLAECQISNGSGI